MANNEWGDNGGYYHGKGWAYTVPKVCPSCGVHNAEFVPIPDCEVEAYQETGDIAQNVICSCGYTYGASYHVADGYTDVFDYDQHAVHQLAREIIYDSRN